jgi:hypothetical protein
MSEDTRENIIHQIENYLDDPARTLDERQRLLFGEMLQLLRDEPEDPTSS